MASGSAQVNQDFALISGYMLLFVIDTVAPYVITVVLKRFRNISLPAKAIKLTAEQMAELEPLADTVAKNLLLNISPEMAFFIMLGLTYFENTMMYLGENSCYVNPDEYKLFLAAKKSQILITKQEYESFVQFKKQQAA